MNGQKLYDVVTLTECLQDPATAAWLAQIGIPLPGVIPTGRYPAPAEIQNTISAVPGLLLHFIISNKTWQMSVTSRSDVSWAILSIKNYSGCPDDPHTFCYTGGWDELILQITAQLVKICGPLVLLHDSGAPPQVIT